MTPLIKMPQLVKLNEFLSMLLVVILFFMGFMVFYELAKLTLFNLPANKESAVQPFNHTLTKAALEELIARASDDKYLHDVLGDKNADKLLPLPTHPIPLLHVNQMPHRQATELAAPVLDLDQKSPAALQRCVYQQQTYVVGDIVKTPQGWIRCTPVIVIKGTTSSSPVWTAVSL